MDEDLELALKMVANELKRSTERYGKFNSMHEGYAVILEELDEAWEEIKNKNVNSARLEMIQVAAMAVRFVLDAGNED